MEGRRSKGADEAVSTQRCAVTLSLVDGLSDQRVLVGLAF